MNIDQPNLSQNHLASTRPIFVKPPSALTSIHPIVIMLEKMKAFELKMLMKLLTYVLIFLDRNSPDCLGSISPSI